MEKKVSIAIIDDDAALASNLKDILEAEGYAVEAVYDGKAGLALFHEKMFDLALVDIKLPPIPGPELVNELSRLRPETEYIMITAHATMETAVEAIKQKQVIGYENKPIDMDRLLTFIREVMRRRQAEEALRESEDKYRNIFNNAQVGIFRTRISDGKVLECNKRFARTYGYKTPEECKNEFVTSEHYTDPGAREKIVASLLKKGEVNNLEACFSRKDGNDVWVRFFARTYPEKGYLEGAGYDITDEKRALEALQKSEAQKKAILDGSIDVIRLVDKEMRIIWVNETAATELKTAPEQLVGSFCYEAVAGKEAPCPGCPTQKALESGKREHALMTQKALKGIKEKTYWDDYAVPVKDESGDILSIIQISRNITDRKSAEEALRESEEKYRSLVETMSEGLVLYDKNNLSTYANNRFCQMLGYANDEIMGRPAIDFLDDDNRKVVEEQILERRKGKREPYEIDWTRKDGQKISTIVSPSPVLDVEARYAGAFAVVTDISELKENRNKLEESVSLLSATLDATADGILVVDKEGKIASFNKRFVEMWRIPEAIIETGEDDQALAFVLDQLKNPESFLKKVKALYSRPDEVSFDVLDFKDGRTFERYSQPQQIEGKSVGRVWSFQNVTARKQAEEALRESKEKYRSVLDSSPDPMVVYDMEGKVIYLNRAFTRVFGWSLEEQTGKKIDNFVPDENWPETRMMINKVTVLGESFSGLETRRYTKEGKVLDISISGACYHDPEGNIAASVINLRDITLQKRLETQLQKATKMEAISTLAGGIAHEFNNALMGILGNVELLKMDLPEDEGRDKYFEAMKSSGHRMSRLTDQLLAYAQGGKYQPRELKLDNFVMQTVPILQHDLNPAIRVETNFPKDISYTNADQTQMQMVLSAILANSDEAIENDGLIKITVENNDIDKDFAKQHPGLKPGYYICITIEDDGKGMDEETRDRIFEPFFTTKFQGRGMGMAAVYGIVKNHDGYIYVDSELGKGTIIHIYLPAISVSVKAQEREEVKEPRDALAMGEGTILVIEDEPVLLKMNREILERLGYRVLEAKTGGEGVEIAKTFDGQIDLALLDIKLPDMSGIQVYPLIMEARPDLKVVVCSGYSIDGPARKVLDAGAEGFIQKPFLIAALAEKLKEVLNSALIPGTQY